MNINSKMQHFYDKSKLIINYLDIIKSKHLLKAPQTLPIINIEITDKCNLKCKTCGYSKLYSSNNKELSLNDYKTLIKQAKEMNCLMISYSGGEPFLRKDFTEIVLETLANKIAVHIDSNGVLLNQEIVKKLNSNKIVISLSLNHSNLDKNDKSRDKGAYKGVINGINLIKKYAPNISILLNITLTSKNFDNICEIAQLAHTLGVFGCNVLPFHDNLQHVNITSKTKSYFDIDNIDKILLKTHLFRFHNKCRELKLKTNSKLFINQILKPELINCYNGSVSANIDPFGNLFPCYDYRFNNSVLQNGLKAAWNSNEMILMRKKVNKCKKTCLTGNSLEPSICFNWKYLLKNPLHLIEVYNKYIS